MKSSANILAFNGIGQDATGIFVEKLREVYARKCSRGLTDMRVSPGPKWFTMTDTERAKSLLAMEWAIERGHSTRARHIDDDCRWWHFSCLLDNLKCDFRVWRDRNRSPYDLVEM